MNDKPVLYKLSYLSQRKLHNLNNIYAIQEAVRNTI